MNKSHYLKFLSLPVISWQSKFKMWQNVELSWQAAGNSNLFIPEKHPEQHLWPKPQGTHCSQHLKSLEKKDSPQLESQGQTFWVLVSFLYMFARKFWARHLQAICRDKHRHFILHEIPMKVMDIHRDMVNLGLILSAPPEIQQRAFINLPWLLRG